MRCADGLNIGDGLVIQTIGLNQTLYLGLC